VTGVFGRPYAHQYDALYGEKNYAAECDAVEELFRRHGSGTMHTLLDLGCGTGTHAMLLAGRGYAVTGVDRSPSMLALARKKSARGAGPPVEFLEGDIRTIRIKQRFDAVVMLFAVLGYQTSDADVAAAMRTVAAHLRPGGVFVCDLWFGPAVLATGTSDREKIIDGPDGRLHRTSSGHLDIADHTCRVNFRTWRTVAGRIVDESAEEHTMRYFFHPELDAFLAAAELEPRAIHPFEDLDGSPGNESWNVWICGRSRAAP
jgi:SAM-dependent methyltransferase